MCHSHILKPGFKIFLLQVVVLFCLSTGCKQHPSAETTALQFFDVLYNEHDLDKAETLVTESSKEKLRNDFKFIEGALHIVKNEEPVHYDYAIVEDKTLIKSDSAFVTVKTVADGSEMKILLLQVKGDWKIDLNYVEISENTAVKVLTDKVMEVMENRLDSIVVAGE